MLTNVMLTNLFLFYLLIRVARFLLRQPACAGSFNACEGTESAGGPSLEWNSPGSLRRSGQQPFARITTIAAERDTCLPSLAQPFGRRGVCHNALVDREALDIYFAQLAKSDNEINDTLTQSSVTVDR
jgi:hypothetical protein